jgi:GNAT superfamily N-acetyltransferase
VHGTQHNTSDNQTRKQMGNRRATSENWWGSLYVHAQIDSHVPRKEPGDWALEISGSILATEQTGFRAGDDSVAEIGIVKAFLIQIREARREGLQASAVLNAKLSATSEYSQLFKKLEWRKRVSRKFEPRSADLLILDRMELKPEYRGHGFGLLAARCMIEMFGSRCGLVACKPYPLQFEGSNRWRPPARVSGGTKALRRARKKLRRYWARVGFQRVPRTMLYALAPKRGLPSFGQMLSAKSK